MTGALIDAQKRGTHGRRRWSRPSTGTSKLWRTLAADCMDERNQLPQDVRAKIVSLSLWIAKYSRTVTRDGASLDPLIEVNRTIMQGLQGAA